MRGLRTQEGVKFIEFFKLVQLEAQKANSVFFLDCGEGNDFVDGNMEGEDLRGWLIPDELADEFEKQWMNGNPGDEWENRITWATWSGGVPKLKITFTSF